MKITEKIIKLADKLKVYPKIGLWAVSKTADVAEFYNPIVYVGHSAVTVYNPTFKTITIDMDKIIIIPTLDWLLNEIVANLDDREDGVILSFEGCIETWHCKIVSYLNNLKFADSGDTKWEACAKILLEMRMDK